MERNMHKKLFAGILALSAGFVLASCDPVSAVPQNYDHVIIRSEDGEISLDGNNLGTLYDSITSERNSKIVNDILSQIAEKKFGTYAEFLEACADNAKKASFIEAHSEFFGTDEHKEERFTKFAEDINDRISEYFYNEITSGSYNDDLGQFSEKKLYNAHLYELYDLAEEGEFALFFVDKELTKENAFSKLHGAYYQVTGENKRGYIQEKVYPDILRNKLVEDYIYKNNPSSLGRAYARELSYVKIAYEGESRFADALMENFAKNHIEVAAEHAEFSIVEDAFKGFSPSTSNTILVQSFGLGADASDPAAAKLLNASNTEGYLTVAADYKLPGTSITIVKSGDYYKETKIGKILEEYEKALLAEGEGRFPTEEHKAALDSFTSDGKSKEYGLLQKVISLMKEDYTTKGWFVKNGGVSELPSAIRDRLFNIRVANSLDDGSLVNENAAAMMGEYEYVYTKNAEGNLVKKTPEEKATRLPYIRKIYDKNIVLPSKALSYHAPDNDKYNYIYHDVDGKAFYICEVYEAPSTAKLNDSSTVYSALEKEDISRQVAKILGTKDSYIKDAYTEYLNKYEFTFFDTALYDYFKSEYPDLDQFDD